MLSISKMIGIFAAAASVLSPEKRQHILNQHDARPKGYVVPEESAPYRRTIRYGSLYAPETVGKMDSRKKRKARAIAALALLKDPAISHEVKADIRDQFHAPAVKPKATPPKLKPARHVKKSKSFLGA